MTAVQPFHYEGHRVRTVSIANETWFVLADLCKVLGLTRGASAVAERLEDGVRQTYPIADRLGRTQPATLVSEAGMYEVVIRSDKPEAAAFRRWITGTVLPEIHRTGSYRAAPVLQGPELIAAALIESQQILQARDARIHQLEIEATDAAPKVAYVDTFVTDADLLKLRTVAGNLGVGETWLRELLIAKKWIYCETATRWSNAKSCKEEVRRYSAYADHKRHFRPVENHDAPRFKDEVMHTLKVTPFGAEAITRLVAKEQAA